MVYGPGQWLANDSLESRIMMVVWLTGWTVGGVMAMVQVALHLDGREIIGIEGGVLWHRVEAFGLGRTRRYDVGGISDFRHARYRHDDEYVPWSMAFHHGSKAIHLAKGLTEAETEELARRLSAYLPARCG